MTIVTLSDLRANLASHLDRVEADRKELVVTRQNHEPVVIMPLAEYDGLVETLHLLGTPANAERLRRSIDALEAGRGTERSLVGE